MIYGLEKCANRRAIEDWCIEKVVEKIVIETCEDIDAKANGLTIALVVAD